MINDEPGGERTGLYNGKCSGVFLYCCMNIPMSYSDVSYQYLQIPWSVNKKKTKQIIIIMLQIFFSQLTNQLTNQVLKYGST